MVSALDERYTRTDENAETTDSSVGLRRTRNALTVLMTIGALSCAGSPEPQIPQQVPATVSQNVSKGNQPKKETVLDSHEAKRTKHEIDMIVAKVKSLPFSEATNVIHMCTSRAEGEKLDKYLATLEKMDSQKRAIAETELINQWIPKIQESLTREPQGVDFLFFLLNLNKEEFESEGAVKFVKGEDFATEVLNAKNKPVVVEFTASWCYPCMLQNSALEDLVTQLGDKVIILKVNIDKESELADKYTSDYNNVPVTLVFVNGQIVEKFPKFTEAADLEKTLKKYIAR